MTRSVFFIAALIAACALTPCLSYGGVVSGNLSINVVPPSGNCPTTAPAAAQRAGFTTLIHCLDGADPANASLANWTHCFDVNQTNPFPPPINAKWHVWFQSQFCDTTHFNQAVDPITGKTTIHFHWHTATDSAQPGTFQHETLDNLSNTVEQGWMPNEHYMAIRFRATQPYMNAGAQPTPDFFTAQNSCGSVTPNCNQPGGDLGYAPIEQDVFEISNFCYPCAYYGGAGVIDWSAGQHGFYLWQMTPTGSDPVVTTYLPNWTPDGGAHTYGYLTTTDGVFRQQYCGYVDDVLIAVNDPANFIINCAHFDFDAAHSLSGTDESHHILNRDGLELFLGGTSSGQPDTDTYIEYIAVWSCAAWQTDPTCKANGLTQ
jgi:hypothetical protein